VCVCVCVLRKRCATVGLKGTDWNEVEGRADLRAVKRSAPKGYAQSILILNAVLQHLPIDVNLPA
jgi:hypothetical protein